jgi:hypothetical protein
MRNILPRALRSDSGQSSIDFIFGFGAFLVTFIFAISFVAGMFTPFQPGAIDLSSVAYRTSAILAEDPGWYIGVNGTPAGTTAWETFSLPALEVQGTGLRIGLAINKTVPDVLSIDKINAFAALAANNYSIARDKLGLNGSIVYNFNVSITANETIPSAMTGPQDTYNVNVLNVTSPYASTDNVELLDRNVMVDMGKALFLNCSAKQSTDNDQWINLTNMTTDDTSDVMIRIFGTANNVDLTKLGWSTIYQTTGPDTWSYEQDYMIYKNCKPVSLPVTFNSSDVVDVVVYNEAFRDPLNNNNLNPNIRYVYLEASNSSDMFPGGNIDYFTDPTFKQIDEEYPATMQLEVWSYAFT